uniref:Caspase-3 n=1 Tax=Urechis unicinctus TaxID=6432 RepID=A0A0M4AYF1_UREUN|nr:caspase-3 [Urechis unicinctus]
MKGVQEKNSIHDVELLEKVMRGLGFDVITHQDLTTSDIHKELAKYANDNEYNKNANCIGVAAMSHSKKEGQFKAADMTISIEEILKPFKLNKKNEDLRNKPRFFFFQACRGTEHDTGHRIEGIKTDNDSETSVPDSKVDRVLSVDRDDDQTEDDDRSQLLPVVSDMICAYSTYKGYTARLGTDGSIFIQTLCSTLTKGAGEFDLVELLTIICNDVTQRDIKFKNKTTEVEMTQKQTPTIVSSLTKKFYLKQR